MSFFPTEETITFDGRVYRLQGDEFWVGGGAASSGYTTLRKFDGSGSDYQIPDATNLEIVGGFFSGNAATAFVTIGYSDDGGHLNAAAGSVTGETEIMGGTAAHSIYYQLVSAGSNYAKDPVPMHLDFKITVATTPGKFLFIRGGSSTNYCRLLVREYV